MRDFVKALVNHEFFTKSVKFENKRFAHDHIAAQICLLELSGQPCNIKDKDLNKMYSVLEKVMSGFGTKIDSYV